VVKKTFVDMEIACFRNALQAFGGTPPPGVFLDAATEFDTTLAAKELTFQSLFAIKKEAVPATFTCAVSRFGS
jgi:hypothetical protein